MAREIAQNKSAVKMRETFKKLRQDGICFRCHSRFIVAKSNYCAACKIFLKKYYKNRWNKLVNNRLGVTIPPREKDDE